MLLALQHQDHQIEYLIGEMEEDLSHQLSQLQSSLNCPAITNRANEFKTQKRKLEFLAARYLLKQLFADCPIVNYDTDGKPFLEHSDWNISITHSGKYVAVARSKSELGIDIELISEKLNRTKHKYCSEQELKNINHTQELFHLCLYWSAKETVYKLVGNEALIFDKEMQIEPFTPQQKGEFQLHLNSKNSKANLMVHYQKIEDYVFTYCTNC